MNIYQFLENKEATLDQIRESVREKVRLTEKDVVLVIGSLAEGFGTIKSDVDLLMISHHSQDDSSSKSLTWANGKALVELEFMSLSEISRQISKLHELERGIWDVSVTTDFSESKLKMLHRLATGLVILGEEAGQSEWRPPTNLICLASYHLARHHARTVAVDMEGHRWRGDNLSLGYAAKEYLGYAADALLALADVSNPLRKWRAMYLNKIEPTFELGSWFFSEIDSISALFWGLHTLPREFDKQSVDSFSNNILNISRYIFFIGDLYFAHKCSKERICELTSLSAGINSSENLAQLPPLKMDFDFSIEIQDNDLLVYLGRLNEFDPPVPVGFHNALWLVNDYFRYSISKLKYVGNDTKMVSLAGLNLIQTLKDREFFSPDLACVQGRTTMEGADL